MLRSRGVHRQLVWWGFVFGIGWAVLFGLTLAFPLPNPSQNFARIVVDEHGEPLRVFADHQGVWRYQVSIDEVSPAYLSALLNYEDRWFYRHRGVNPFALLRAAGQWLANGRLISGGSTITMQVARIISPHPRTVAGKALQMFRAVQLELSYSKQDILTLYLNSAPFGGTVEGVQAASYMYFGKSANQLSDAEAALLAVLPQSPTRLRPDRHPKRAQQARDKVLTRLQTFGVWSESRVSEAMMESVIAQRISAPKVAPLLARRAIQTYPQAPVIRTTLNKNLQKSIEQIVEDYTVSLSDKTSAAVLVLDNRTAEIKAYVGSAKFDDLHRFGHVDMVTANRSPGSTLKPFLYGLAIDEGLIHEQSLLLDVPSNFSGYRPENFHQGYSGPVSARQALQRSLNVPAVQVLQELGAQTFYAHLASAGLPLQLPKNAKPNLSLILGGGGASLEHLTAAFSALGRGGMVSQPIFVKSGEAVGEAVSAENTTEPLGLHSVGRPLLTPQSAWIVGEMLRGVALNSVHRKTVIASRSPRIAFKTGTSYGYRDAWVLASSQRYTFGVWVGRPDGTPSAENVGRQTAVPLLQRVLALFGEADLAPPKRPHGVTQGKVCWPLGGLQSLQKAEECHRPKRAWLAGGTAPATLREPLMAEWAGYRIPVKTDSDGYRVLPGCERMGELVASHLQHKNIAVWPQAVEPWLPQKWRRQTLLPPLASRCDSLEAGATNNLVLEGIREGAQYYPLAGTHPHSSHSLKLQVSLRGAASGSVEWFLDGRWLTSTERSAEAVAPFHQVTIGEPSSGSLSQGQHSLSVMDAAGRFLEVTFYVGEG